MPITSVPDHVAVAVRDIDVALQRWRDDLGGRVQWRFHNPAVFGGAAVQFRGGAFLELLQPSDSDERVLTTGGPADFMRRYLDRHGPGVHHVTLKVPDLHEALATIAEAGLDAVDVDDSDPHWREAFLRPSQVGGLIVQLAATDWTTEEQAVAEGSELQPVPDEGAVLLGPRLGSDDLDAAAATWTTLGGTVAREGDALRVRWEGSPLTIEIVPAATSGPIGLRFGGTAPRPPDERLGAAVLATA